VDATIQNAGPIHRPQLEIIQDIFDQIDVNRDGLIRPADLRNYFQQIGRSAPEAQVQSWIRDRGIDQDGAVSFKEFVMSLPSLFPPDTTHWAEVSSCFLKGDASDCQVLDKMQSFSDLSIADSNFEGVSNLTMAFGGIRLCATQPECAIALNAAREYIERIINNPSTQSFWRIPVSDKSFEASIGRLGAGKRFMQALDFSLEENGTVFALRASTGKRWGSLPKDILQNLRRKMHELRLLEQSLTHPCISHVAAVSSAVARLADNAADAQRWSEAIETVVRILSNIISNPTEAKFRRLNMTNKVLQSKLVNLPGGVQLLLALGFKENQNGELEIAESLDIAFLRARRTELEVCACRSSLVLVTY
jgi:hypothetical protein